MIGRGQFAITVFVAAFALPAEAGPFDPPKPEAFARKEDQARAKLLTKPCSETDLGNGCRQWGGRIIRESPCTYLVSATSMKRLPLDQCYKMEKQRKYRGVWIDAFEGQRFIRADVSFPDQAGNNPEILAWLKNAERTAASRVWLDVSRTSLTHDFSDGGRKMLIEFIGRKTKYAGPSGHMGVFDHTMIVDRVISVVEVK